MSFIARQPNGLLCRFSSVGYREIGEITGELKCLERLYRSICDLPQDDIPKEFYTQAARVAEKGLAAANSRLSEILKRA